MRGRRRTSVLAALVLAIGALPVLGPPAQAATCVESQRFRLTGTITHVAESWQYSSGGKPRLISTSRHDFAAGSNTLEVTTCKIAGKWKLMSPVGVTTTYSGLAANGSTLVVTNAKRGFGTPISRVSASAVVTSPVECKNVAGFTGVAKEIFGLPLPLPWWGSVGAWVATKLSPDRSKTHCHVYTAPSIPLKISSTGRVVLPNGTVRSSQYLGSQNLVDLQILSKREMAIVIRKL